MFIARATPIVHYFFYFRSGKDKILNRELGIVLFGARHANGKGSTLIFGMIEFEVKIEKSMLFSEPLPLSLYIHIPWCIKKCPYCDFNSHRAGKNVPEDEYINRLIEDLEVDLPRVWGRKIHSIFIGGGTPSLFSAKSIERLLQAIHARLTVYPDAEITLEANPGTFEQEKFRDYRLAGINRLSVGIQSFQSDKLQALGRVHDADEAKRAIEIIHEAGFTNFNIDLMHGLPNQSIEDALYDLQTAIDFNPPHLSWYQLTLEPDTVFARYPPRLPDDEKLWLIQEEGNKLLAKHGYEHYEISAYSQPNHRCHHNLNYWRFGDYLGIGAGAHGKITDMASNSITRTVKTRNPSDYLNSSLSLLSQEENVLEKAVPFEFMLNALRLIEGVEAGLFPVRTGLPLSVIEKELTMAREKGFLEKSETLLKATVLGQFFLNDCLDLFL